MNSTFLSSVADQALVGLAQLLVPLLLAFVGGVAASVFLRRRALRWSWAGGALVLTYGVRGILEPFGSMAILTAVVAVATSLRWHLADLRAGGDLAELARQRVGLWDVQRRARLRRSMAREEWLDDRGLLIGTDARGRETRIPFNLSAGTHTLVVGATGSGKTVTQSWMAVRAIELGQAAIVIDPKGDGPLRRCLRDAAQSAGRAFLEWSPEGPLVYNPYGAGADTEIVDKVLAAERYTEPHYLRQAQRYLGHAIRAMRAAGITISPDSLVRHLEPIELEVLGRRLPEAHAREVWKYLDSLSPRQVRDLSGTRDRVAVLAESDVGRWLDPGSPSVEGFDLDRAQRSRAVVLFRLEADRRPLLAQMLGAAIVQDLLALAARRQGDPLRTLVMIDEFSALGAPGVARLFARTRAAGISLLLGTQELSDLRVGPGGGVLDQVLGNISVLVGHRQVVPRSAELVSAVAGTEGSWSSSQQTRSGPLGTSATTNGTRTRDREQVIHPDEVRRLPAGSAAVIVPAGPDRPAITRILMPTPQPRSRR